MLDQMIPWKRNRHSGGDGLSVSHGEDPIAMLRREFDNLVDRLWNEGGLARRDDQRWVEMGVDFDEDDSQYVLTAQLPGFEPHEIDIKVSGRVLTVKAEHQEESEGKNGRHQRYGSFYESFTLPAGIESDSIDARYHNGLLEVHLPKDETAPAKRIEVNSA